MRSRIDANVGPDTTSAMFAGIAFGKYGHAARDDRSGHCARICDSIASSSGGRIAGTAGFTQVAPAPEPLIEKNSSTSCERAESHAGCRSSLGCALAQPAKAASIPSSASRKR